MTVNSAVFVLVFLVTVLGFILTVVIVSAYNGAAQEREKRAKEETRALKSLTDEAKAIDEEIANMSDEALRERIRGT